VVEPLVYKSADHAAQPVAEATPSAAVPQAAKLEAKKKQGLFGGIGRFFRRIFGAE